MRGERRRLFDKGRRSFSNKFASRQALFLNWIKGKKVKKREPLKGKGGLKNVRSYICVHFLPRRGGG